MLTDKEMLEIADRFIRKIVDKSIEPMIYIDDIIKKSYGNIYHFNSKKYISTGDFKYALMGGGPFLVEKEGGRVVNFGTAGDLDDQLEAYKNRELGLCLTNYWYPDEDRFDYK